MPSMTVSNPAGRIVIGVVVSIIIFKLLFSGATHISHGTSWHGSWQLKLPSWAKPEVVQDRHGFMPVGEELDALCARYRWPPFPDRYHHRKIFDLIMVNDEIEALSLRMGQMDEVDYFVILESETTFSDQAKPLHVEENWDLFQPYHHKMIRATLNITGQTFGSAWDREGFSRNAMFLQVFPTLTEERTPLHGDVMIVGDVDELVRPEVLTALRNCEINPKTKLWTRFYYYSFQWLQSEGHAEWAHPDATFYQGMEQTILPQDLRSASPDADVYSAGWHCSYCFSKLSDIVSKLKSFSHQEMNTPDFTSPANGTSTVIKSLRTTTVRQQTGSTAHANNVTILERVRFGKDLFNRADLYRIDNNRDVPDFIVKNADQFGFMLDRDTEDGNFRDAWDLLEAEEAEKKI